MENAAQGHITVHTGAAQEAQQLAGLPVMVSILKSGSVTQQSEVHLGQAFDSYACAVGVYEVRVEGDGIITLEKHGIHVLPDQNTSVLATTLQPGEGTRIVEYALDSASLTEVARAAEIIVSPFTEGLKQLETLIEQLDKTLQAFKKLDATLQENQEPATQKPETTRPA